MNEYDGMLDEAEDLAEEDISEKLSASKVDLSKVREAFKDHPDREEMEKLIRTAESNTGAAVKKKAWAELLKVGGKVLIKVAKTAILPLLALFLLSSPLRAASAFPVLEERPSSKQAWTLGGFLVDKVLETKAIYAAAWPGGEIQHSGGLYVPIHTYHSKEKNKEDEVDYIDWGIGGEDVEGKAKLRPIIPVMVNAPAVSRALWNTVWRKDHIRTTSFPPIWIGPLIRGPVALSFRGLKSYVFGHNILAGVSFQFGKIQFKDEERK